MCSTEGRAQGGDLDALVAEVIGQLEETLASDVAADGLGGMTAAVMSGSELMWIKGFGWADADKRIPAGPNTIYRIGSISKTVTAVVLMQLVERRVVSLDDPVRIHLPEFERLYGPHEDVRSVTIRQLASHTAGLVREPLLEDAAAGPIEQWETKVVESIPHAALIAPPGSNYAYSNIGFGILGAALSRAAKRPFMELVHDQIFEPLGMRASAFILTPSMTEHLSTGYLNLYDGTVNTELPAREHAGRGYKVPNGGVYTTAGDLGRFIASLSGASATQILSPESRRLLRTNNAPEGATQQYGLGLQLQFTEDVLVAGHGGGVAGYTAHAAYNPDTMFAVVLLRNYFQGKTNLAETSARVLAELARLNSGKRH